jgi:uncharacterized protein (TIGR03083 family)
MAIDRMGALVSERTAAVTLLQSLDAAHWEAPSRCDGWTVKDVVAHMAASVHGLFTPWAISMMRTRSAERFNDSDVSKRRD